LLKREREREKGGKRDENEKSKLDDFISPRERVKSCADVLHLMMPPSGK
jgi:hypothetical protein